MNKHEKLGSVNLHDDKHYYTDTNGTIRRTAPKVRMSKKERLRLRWEGKEEQRFEKTGRGNCNVDEIERVKKYFRDTYPDKMRKMDIAKSLGINQARTLIILNLLSGVSEDKKDEGAEFVPKDFLIYEDEDSGEMRYGIYKDVEMGIYNGEKTGGEK